MANWAFEIDVADDYIVGLTETLVDKGFRVWCFHRDGQPHYLFSSVYLSATPEAQVYALARQLVRFIDGLSYLLFENKSKVHKIVLTRVINVDTFSVVNVPRGNEEVAIDFSVYTPGVGEEEDMTARVLNVAAVDEFVSALLLALSQGMDFKSMYESYELIREFVMAKGAVLSVSKGMQERFLRAAIGIASRHEQEATMSLKEAQELVTALSLSVLAQYYKLDLAHHVIKEQHDFYDTMYD